MRTSQISGLPSIGEGLTQSDGAFMGDGRHGPWAGQNTL